MIGSLKGRVQSVAEDHLVLEVGGVGYLVQASGRALAKLQPDEAVFMLVETQIRAESITLFGFLSAAERDWFQLLNTVQGVGGRLALAILGTLSGAEIAEAITLDDRATLTRAPGVGPRLAARLLTELKGKLPASAATADIAALAPAPAGSASSDAVSALQNLGFRPADAARAVAETLRAAKDAPDTATLIRHALKRLSR